MDEEPIENLNNCAEPTTTSQTDSKDSIFHDLEEKCFKCINCSFATDWASSFQEHLLIHIKNESETIDVKPFENSDNYAELTTTAQTVSKDNVLNDQDKKCYKCINCSFATDWASSFQEHSLIHVKNDSYSMDVKPFENGNGNNFEEPRTPTDSKENVFNDKEEKFYNCNDCSFATNRVSSFEKHSLIHLENELHSCLQCGKAFAKPTALKTHMRIHTKKKTFKCKVCKFMFAQREGLKSHMLTHTQERPYKCEECGAAFNQSGTLKTHQLVHSKQKPYTCDKCNKAFNQARHLKTHMFSHTGEKPFQCNQCEKTFTRADNMKTHLVYAHSGKKPYKCEECDEAFARADSLATHALIHAEEEQQIHRGKSKSEKPLRKGVRTNNLFSSEQRPYKCGICEASFTRTSSLKKHQLTHSDKKKFKCAICGSCRFKRKWDLKIHIESHNRESHLKCSICDSNFKTRKALKTHIASEH